MVEVLGPLAGGRGAERVAQLERADGLLGERARVAASYTERLGQAGGAVAGEGDEAGLVLPCADRGPERRSWFVYAVRLPRGADRDAVVADLSQRGVDIADYLVAASDPKVSNRTQAADFGVLIKGSFAPPVNLPFTSYGKAIKARDRFARPGSDAASPDDGPERGLGGRLVDGRRATAAPMPELAPVTSAQRPRGPSVMARFYPPRCPRGHSVRTG